MENMENCVHLEFCILINIDNFGSVNFFQKCVVWEIANLAKKSKFGKRDEK
jgi:hypothetical protein